MPLLDYPSHLVEDWQLSDGTPVRIRPIRAEDLAMHTAFVGGLSKETGYRRLLSPRTPQPDELWRMTHIDYDRELALIATTMVDGSEQQMGVVRYVRGDTPETARVAEFAIVIADAWQHHGLARKLMSKLIDAAAAAGVRQLADITLYDNTAMLALARKLGFKVQRDPGNPNVTWLRLALDAPAGER
ncbi:GNAT family N-acetyltransferase [Variovorax sp. NFACC27]|uniref:GNAT family N-acetyltransferase n=1 Tax=unclassified Variovorax TaxID=663243 RepID=UPI0008978891|nr:L-amino acid N-acyltransferase YncA [Variovorax sp. NFACC28]SEG76688.1 L-amino acid N-acyltransferase YncA [Variovorax sp. NFACC29]SFC99681.1 L-amino acid N-acyltransferase YncA [Variovorax sp. NFACC26]SFG11813.1 L-amino acid N-acyltransferase YncA [Variovorax sp. NFACC27]